MTQSELHCHHNSVSSESVDTKRNSTLSHHDYRTRMAVQHAQGDRLGKVLAWLLREVHHGTPAMSIRIQDGTIAPSQLTINENFRNYYRQLYEKPVDLDAGCVLSTGRVPS
ncbi:hypothetical protein NDU88_002117 [Pleurodeles waltl]|uniref:Uncharacterized protein n=1 Tax=Pleurodeles waltl TaxID=8319 RepID=A0AAV7WMS9_PLEWA|nr:hypothetical protein NDU88_002117 [Pleurodeles waltl]